MAANYRIADSRYGVRAYQNAELVEKLNETNPEDRLLNLIDLNFFTNANRREPWTGTAAELERRLTRDGGSYQREAQRLLGWTAACGSYLARLAKSDRAYVAGRVTARSGRGGIKTWTIIPPVVDEPVEELLVTPAPGQPLPPVPSVRLARLTESED